MPDSNQHSGRCPSCGLSPYESGIGDADISRIVAERNGLIEQLEAWQALSTRQDAFIRYLRPDLDASRARADHLVERFNTLSYPAKEPDA